MALEVGDVHSNGYCPSLLPKMPTLLTSPVLKGQSSPKLEAKLSPLLGFQTSPDLECSKEDDALPVASLCESRQLAKNTNIVNSVARLSDVEFIEDVDLSHDLKSTSDHLQRLMQSVEELWCDRSVRFGGTCAELFGKNNGSKLTILSRTDCTYTEGCRDTGALVGFIVYKIKDADKKLYISRVAVMPEFRGHGYGRLFLEWCLRQPGVSKLALTATARALGFYRAFGFRKVATWHQGGSAHPDEEPTDEQVYMEFCRSTAKGKKQRKARR